jgi:hypothetical protein
MPQWFVRHQGKVFGPFDEDRLRSLIDAGQVDPAAEFGESWQGPWSPLGAFQRGRPVMVPPLPRPPDQAVSPATDGHSEVDLPRIDRRAAGRSTRAYGRGAATPSRLPIVGLMVVVAAVAASVTFLVTDFPAIRKALTGRPGPAKTAKKRSATSPQRADAKPGKGVGSDVGPEATGTASRTSRGAASNEQPVDRSGKAAKRLPSSTDSAGFPRGWSEPNASRPTDLSRLTDETGLGPDKAEADARRRLELFNVPALDPDRIDVGELRRMAEELGKRELAKADMEVVEDIVTLTKEREWRSKNPRIKERGEVTLILPDKVRFRNDKGEGPWDRDDLSASSRKVIDEIAKRAVDLYELNTRVLKETKDAAGE